MNFLVFICSIILSIILLPSLFIYSMFHYLLSKEKKMSDFWLNNAITIDILGNINGEALEHFCTNERKTLFGQRGVTISASLGELWQNNKLNIRGAYLVVFIDFIFWLFAKEDNHCINAYNLYLSRHK